MNRVYIPSRVVPNGHRYQVFRSGADALVESIQFTANCVLMTKKGAWDAGWDERDQTNMFLGHLGFVQGATNSLGAAVDTVDKNSTIRKSLLNSFALPNSYG